MSKRENILDGYRKRLIDESGQLQKMEFWSSQLTWIRGCCILFALAVWGICWFQLETLWWMPGLAATLLFLVVAATNEYFDRQAYTLGHLVRITKNSIACMERDWAQIENRSIAPPESRDAVAQDLDLVGKSSLYRLVAWTRTRMGKSTLRDWLLLTPTRREVLERQEAVKQLVEETSWRHEMQMHSEQLAASATGPDALISWAEAPAWLATRPWLKWWTRALTFTFVVFVIGVLSGLIPKTIGGYVLVAVAALNFATTVCFVGAVHQLFNQISSRQNDVAHYRKLFLLLKQSPTNGAMLGGIHEDSHTEGGHCYQHIDRLGNIMVLANIRRSGLFGIFYLILQSIILWDFHVLAGLEHWQRQHGQSVRKWFAALGRLEALASLSRISHEEPEWAFPTIIDMAKAKQDPSLLKLEAEDLGHPLIPEGQRVCNSTAIGPPGTVLLVTGSNMSGKSTLLRSLGVNIALAHAGAKVCCTSLSLPISHIETSMRIQDSLNEGVSFFMAELRRLKAVVDLAVETKSDPDRCFFYLLDEILQGTNSRERHIAVQEVIRHLIEYQAIGAVSTHDLELANADGLGDVCNPIHFRETIHTEAGERKMTFDFKLREGVSTTSNALKLLELVGLREPNTDESSQELKNSHDDESR